MAGIGGITTAVIEEITDVVGLEDLDQPFIFRLVLFQTLQLVTTGPEGP